MNKEIIQEKNIIERFVLNRLNEEELDEFLVYQMMHPDVQELIELKREEIKSVRALKDGIPRPSKNMSGKRGFFLEILVIFTLIIAGIWYFGKDSNTNEPATSDRTEAISNDSSIENTLKEKSTPLQEPKQEKPKTEKQKDKTPRIKEKNDYIPPTTVEKPPENLPIAANFEPNPDIELFIGNHTRSAGFEFEMKRPITNDKLLFGGEQTTIPFEGVFKDMEAADTQEGFQIHLFSNDKDAFNNFEPLWTKTLELKTIEEGFGFYLESSIVIPEGIYYWMVENTSGSSLYGVGKFTVERK